MNDLGRVLDALGPAQVRNVNQAIDPRLDLDERAEGREVANRAGELGAGRVFHGQTEPRVLFDLLHAERDLLVVRVDLEHHRFDVFSDRHDLRRMPDVARPRHLRDMDEPLDALLELHERTVIGD